MYMAQQCSLLSSAPLHNSQRQSSTIARRKTASLWPAKRARQLKLDAQGAQQTVTTVENIYLLSFPEEFAQDAGAAAVDSIWSLQYLVPGALCGAAGPLSEVPIAGLQQLQQPAEQIAASSVTHAVLLRFPNSRSLEAFQGNPKTEDIIARVLDGGCHGVSILSVTTQLPNSLEALFRRGGDFDVGFELVAALQLREGASQDDAAEVLGLLQQLAESSAFGAVQAAYGPSSPVQHQWGPADVTGQPAAAGANVAGSPAGSTASSNASGAAGTAGAAQAPIEAADFVLLARFQMQEQLQEFLNCAPVTALLKGDERLPLRAAWAGVMEIAPTEKSQSSSSGRGRLL